MAMFQCTEFAERDVERLLHAINAVAAAPVPDSQITAGLRRTWSALHDKIGRIDFSRTNDEDHETARDDEIVDDWLHEIEDKILEHVAWAGDQQPVELLQIARAIGEDRGSRRNAALRRPAGCSRLPAPEAQRRVSGNLPSDASRSGPLSRELYSRRTSRRRPTVPTVSVLRFNLHRCADSVGDRLRTARFHGYARAVYRLGASME